MKFLYFDKVMWKSKRNSLLPKVKGDEISKNYHSASVPLFKFLKSFNQSNNSVQHSKSGFGGKGK